MHEHMTHYAYIQQQLTINNQHLTCSTNNET